VVAQRGYEPQSYQEKWILSAVMKPYVKWWSKVVTKTKTRDSKPRGYAQKSCAVLCAVSITSSGPVNGASCVTVTISFGRDVHIVAE
jgi:hypothetical protein